MQEMQYGIGPISFFVVTIFRVGHWPLKVAHVQAAEMKLYFSFL